MYHLLWRLETLHYTCTLYLWVSYAALTDWCYASVVHFVLWHNCVVSMFTHRSVVSCPIECRSIVQLFSEAQRFWPVISGRNNHACSVAACTRVTRQLWYLLRTSPLGATEVGSLRSAVRMRSGYWQQLAGLPHSAQAHCAAAACASSLSSYVCKRIAGC